MTRRNVRLLVAFASGLVFGAGLIVSGMTRPAKILGFLDPFGAWDPSLVFVMVGAVGVYALAVRSRRRAPLAQPQFSAAPVARIDRPLLVGAAVFGVGWALGGYCPGPSVVSLASGGFKVALFVGCMLLGTLAAAAFEGHSDAAPRDGDDRGFGGLTSRRAP